ncbi:coth protein-domain-containing protein [Pilobolus umbonatus]|nr:coth protein-domain-containing protein [Pilobolus umbonatus]
MAPSNVPYNYVKLRKGTNGGIVETESFVRDAVASGTPNEFFGRNWNTKNMVGFDTIQSIIPQFNRSKNSVHPVGEISTIHITAPQAQVDTIHKRYLEDIEVVANMTYIGLSSVQSFSNIQFSLSGRSTRYLTKLSYSLKLQKKGPFLNDFRRFKLRTTGLDPSYMRDYLSCKMYQAANLPSTGCSFVRVFINNRPMGLFLFADKYDEKWLANTFGGGSQVYKKGILYEGEGGARNKDRADFSYRGDTLKDYAESAYSISEAPSVGTESLDELIQFIKFIRQELMAQKIYDNNGYVASMTEWEKKLDVEGFLACMALEFANGGWDGYLQNTNNYFLYKSPEQNRFIYISWDFDFSLGSGPVEMAAISVGDYNYYGGVKLRPLMVALLNVPQYRSLFEANLQKIMNTFYELGKAYPVIDSIVELIREDVEWDRALPRARSGINFIPTNIQTILNNNATGDSVSLPIAANLFSALDFVIRVNDDINLTRAINGRTLHISLYAIKDWFRDKLDNYKKKTKYSPFLRPLPQLDY